MWLNSGYRSREAIKALLSLSYDSDIWNLNPVCVRGKVCHLYHRRVLRKVVFFILWKSSGKALGKILKYSKFILIILLWSFWYFCFLLQSLDPSLWLLHRSISFPSKCYVFGNHFLLPQFSSHLNSPGTGRLARSGGKWPFNSLKTLF